MMRFGLSLIALLWTLAVQAAIDPYEFKSDAERERYQHFIEEMRCPKCQNQNLAGSDAPIATDLRRELRRLLEQGHSDSEIVEHMVARYGEYVLYDPPLNRKTLILWLAPALFLAVGVGVVIVIVRRHRPAVSSDTGAELSAEERARLQQLLRGDNNDKAKREERT